MKLSISSAQSQQTKQRLTNPQESLSYELGKAVQELPPFYTRLLAAGVSLLVFGAITWAYFSKVDEVAAANGKLIPSTEVRPVRSLSAGSVLETKVKAGATVKKDDVLVDIDPGATGTNVESLEKEAKELQSTVTRLESENRGETGTGSAERNQLNTARLREFQEKQASAIAEANRQVATIGEARTRLVRFQENLTNARTNLVNSKATLKNAQEREEKLRSLAGSVVPRLDYLNAVDQLNNARNQVTDAEDKIISLEKEADAQQDRIRQSQQAYEAARTTAESLAPQRQGEVLTQLVQKREELSKKQGEIAVAKQQKKERETLKAPFDGTVYNVKVTQGPVQPGEELLSILPEGKELILDVKVPNRDIGFIRKGLPAKVKFATFPYQEFGIVQGEVLEISPDAVVEKDENGKEMGPVFPTKIQLKKRTIEVHGKPVELTPGMVASAEIVTRQKSILTFLIEPVTRRFSEAFSVR